MDNYVVAENFTLLSKLMDIHGDNSFKAKSYSIAAFAIEKLQKNLTEMSPAELFAEKGIGDSMGKKIVELLSTGRLKLLDEYIERTPMGVIEMLKIKGLGPKKIAVIWKQLEIESLGELLYACNENRLTLYKGFGEKTQEKIKESIEYHFSTLGSYLYAQIESYALQLDEKLKKVFPADLQSLTGEFRRQLEVITKLEWVTTVSPGKLKEFFGSDYTVQTETPGYLSLKGSENVLLGFYEADKNTFCKTLFETSCSTDFLDCWKEQFSEYEKAVYNCEADIFSNNRLGVIPHYLREHGSVIKNNNSINEAGIIQPADIKGIIHSHSNWSDGVDSIETMAREAGRNGIEYLVISDHSKTAAYAQGLTEDRIQAQHQLIDSLNRELQPFKIFKSIESDILGDGSLDYSNEILSSFDLVIASVHSNLYMTEEKAMMRLIKAIENPYTSILGHMTGRLLLSRKEYPVNHRKIIDACAANNVVIELNANPRRLDMDWRHISYAVEKGVLISINPDAHDIQAFNHTRYGVLVAQKAGLLKEQNLSSFSLGHFEEWLKGQHSKRNQI